MSEKATKTPQIRFDGYTDAWEQRSLGNVAKITMGQSPNSENYTENPSDYILVQGNADMKDGRVVPRVWTTQVTKTADKGDLILSVRAPVGDIGKTDYDVVLGRGVAAIKGNEFLFQSLGRMKKNGYWTKLSTGSTFESINSNDIKEAQILLPSLDEQQKIGTFFKQLDNTIALHQRECDLLAKMKKSYLQKMFPKNGEDKPEIRFDGYTDAWEQRKFEKFAQRQSNTMISNPDNPCIEYEDVISEQGILNKDVCSKDAEKNGIIFTEEDILYGKLRPYLHNWLNPDFKGVAVGDWWVLRPINMDKNFLYWLIQTPQYDNAANQSSGTKMPRADWKLVSNTDFYVPISNEEQAKIAGLFEKINTLITLHQRELDSLKKMKKSLLQMMFV
ncbi:restriction endonuclease subunit S [Streptococcus macedonicus]|uniref:restriction endonuclease subunit S n=1 Tax=Streptococcus macedonicus TaxID=59310 RepID=UPI001BDC9E4D|nr:restriction endonuclease subunit S [Streptococcus macedonicus]MBT1048031.1 restriction endonuclease subunit S [Streptococcus macedonicus]